MLFGATGVPALTAGLGSLSSPQRKRQLLTLIWGESSCGSYRRLPRSKLIHVTSGESSPIDLGCCCGAAAKILIFGT